MKRIGLYLTVMFSLVSIPALASESGIWRGTSGSHVFIIKDEQEGHIVLASLDPTVQFYDAYSGYLSTGIIYSEEDYSGIDASYTIEFTSEETARATQISCTPRTPTRICPPDGSIEDFYKVYPPLIPL